MTHRNLALVAFFALFAAVPVFAHHSINAEFYPNKDWIQTGVLTKIDLLTHLTEHLEG